MPSHEHILFYTHSEKLIILESRRKNIPVSLQIIFANISAIVEDLAFCRIIEPKHQLYYRGLTRAVMSYKRRRLSFLYNKRKIVYDLFILISKRNIPKFKALKFRIRHISVVVLGQSLLILKKAFDVIYKHGILKYLHDIVKQSYKNPRHSDHETRHDRKLCKRYRSRNAIPVNRIDKHTFKDHRERKCDPEEIHTCTLKCIFYGNKDVFICRLAILLFHQRKDFRQPDLFCTVGKIHHPADIIEHLFIRRLILIFPEVQLIHNITEHKITHERRKDK